LLDWGQVRRLLRETFGETKFELWLARLVLVAVDNDRALVVAAPAQMRAWVRTRFGRQLNACAQRTGRVLRLGEEAELAALEYDEFGLIALAPGLETNHKEATSC
jgi:hypothetical protein